MESKLCLQAPSDILTRKPVFDSLVSGYIPMLFDPFIAYYQYLCVSNVALDEVDRSFVTKLGYPRTEDLGPGPQSTCQYSLLPPIRPSSEPQYRL